jgi:hypothetical protein
LNAATSIEFYYTQALYWFHSTAWSAQKLGTIWHEWLLTHKAIYRLKGEPVYLGDGIKVSKEGRKMPAVKKLHYCFRKCKQAEMDLGSLLWSHYTVF